MFSKQIHYKYFSVKQYIFTSSKIYIPWENYTTTSLRMYRQCSMKRYVTTISKLYNQFSKNIYPMGELYNHYGNNVHPLYISTKLNVHAKGKRNIGLTLYLALE